MQPYVFFGSPRSVLVPLVTIQLSLTGTFAMMSLMGFSINLLTLLALVLAIGLVVDNPVGSPFLQRSGRHRRVELGR